MALTTADRRDRALATLAALPAVELARYPTPIDELSRLRSALGGGPRLLVKRDDAIAFAFGGNKVRKIELVAARALAEGADTLVTAGGVQSNHARVTAAAAAKLGLRAVLVVNGTRPERLTANALLDELSGARVRYVPSRADRAPAMADEAERLRAEGRRPFVIPIGASTALGASAFVRAVGEMVEQGVEPDVIVHSTSSAGTQAGLVAGCSLLGLRTRVIGVSADDPAGAIAADADRLLSSMGELLGVDPDEALRRTAIEVDDSQVGGGYGVATAASREAIELAARTEALFLDPTYTSKAMAGLIARVRARTFPADGTVLFWHTGGQVGLFA